MLRVFLLIISALLCNCQLNKQHTVLLFGRLGSGKSYLANQLIGRKVFEEGSSLHAVTLESQYKQFPWREDPSRLITIVDSRGFNDNTGKRSDILEETLRLAQEMKNSFDIIFYTISLRNGGFNGNDLKVLKILTRWLGNDIFKNNLIIVFTQGNLMDTRLAQSRLAESKQKLMYFYGQEGIPYMRTSMVEANPEYLDDFRLYLTTRFINIQRCSIPNFDGWFFQIKQGLNSLFGEDLDDL